MLFSSLVVLAVDCVTPAVNLHLQLATKSLVLSVLIMTLNGRALSRFTYSQLLHVIGVSSCGEGDHIDTFNICDLRGRTVIGAGQGGGGLTNRKLAEVAGVEQAIVGFRMQTCGQGGATCKNQEPLYVDVMQP